jgi:Tfp pilus assembly protein PilV
MLDARGFTIVEVVVACFILTVGLLGTLSTFAAVARMFQDGHASIEASAHAAELLESVRGEGCNGTTAGARSEGTVSYFWRTDEIAPDLRRVTVVVSSARARIRADTFSAILPC